MPPTPPFRRLNQLLDTIRAHHQKQSATGPRGERAAADYLKQNNYRIIARNLRNRYGEIDLIAIAPDGRTVAIIEVKTAEDPNARPELRVNLKKQKKLTALAAQLVRRYKLQDKSIRFDVIAVNLPEGKNPIIRHYPGAFESLV